MCIGRWSHSYSVRRYLSRALHYATVFADDPHGCITSGLRFWKAPYAVNDDFAEAVWDIAWQVVTTYPDTGVNTTTSPDAGGTQEP